jgi:hypothetical protein
MIHDARPVKLQPKALLPESSTGNTFASFFPYYFNWIYSPSNKIAWHTETRYPLTPRTLWEKHQDSRQIIGVRFGNLTEYAMIDIDRKSLYHPFNSVSNYDTVLKAMNSIGLQGSICIRSSGSEGLHLYFPLPYSINTFGLACAMRYALEAHRLEIANGTLETFPNTKGFDCEYNAHRLPLQNGSYILRDDFVPLSNKVERFVDRWFDVAQEQDLELLVDQMAIAKNLHKPKFATSGKLNDWRQELESIMSTGWTGKGETNQILFKVCEYARVFLGYSDLSKLVNWVTDKVTQLNGFNEHCDHKHDILKRVRDWGKWVLDHRFPMQDKKTREDIAVKKREVQREETLQRIKEVANSLYDRNGDRLTIRAMAQAIAKQAHCSVKTLYNNLSLWHPEHRDTVTANTIDSTAELEAVTLQQESAKSESQSTVTQKPYEVLARGSSNPKSLKFAASTFEPLPTAVAPRPDTPPAPPQNPSFFDNIKIKLLESKIANRRSGRIDASVLLEIESLESEIREIKNKNCVTNT